MRRLSLFALVVFSVVAIRGETPAEAAAALLKAKDLPAARDAFAKIAAADPQNADAHFQLGVIAGQLDDNDTAIREFEQATALAPTNSRYLIELGGAYGTAAEKAGLLSKLSWAKKCQTALEKAVQVDPDSIPARNALASYYRAAPTFAGGGMSKAYEQAAEIKKRDPIAGAAILGQLYLAEKKIDQAFAIYDEALKAAPNNYAVLYGIGRAAAQTAQHLDEGAAALHHCLELTPPDDQPGHAPVHWRLGNIAERRGDTTAARAAYEAALKEDPKFHQAADALAKLK